MDEERKDAAKIHVIYLLKQRLLSEDRFFTILLLVVAFRRGEQIFGIVSSRSSSGKILLDFEHSFYLFLFFSGRRMDIIVKEESQFI